MTDTKNFTDMSNELCGSLITTELSSSFDMSGLLNSLSELEIKSIVNNDSKIVSLLIFCDIIYKNYEDGIYMYNNDDYYKAIEEMNSLTYDYINNNYGIIFAIPSENDTYNIRVMFEKRKNASLYYYDICMKKYTDSIFKIIEKIKNNIVKFHFFSSY